MSENWPPLTSLLLGTDLGTPKGKASIPQEVRSAESQGRGLLSPHDFHSTPLKAPSPLSSRALARGMPDRDREQLWITHV